MLKELKWKEDSVGESLYYGCPFSGVGWGRGAVREEVDHQLNFVQSLKAEPIKSLGEEEEEKN